MNKITMFKKDYNTFELYDSLGVKDLVFDLVTAIEFIIDASHAGKLILGGDILKKKNGHYTYCYDNWYCQSNNVNETCQVALDYLRKYLQLSPNVDWIVSVVIS